MLRNNQTNWVILTGNSNSQRLNHKSDNDLAWTLWFFGDVEVMIFYQNAYCSWYLFWKIRPPCTSLVSSLVDHPLPSWKTAGSNPGRVKPKTLTLVLAKHLWGAPHKNDGREETCVFSDKDVINALTFEGEQRARLWPRFLWIIWSTPFQSTSTGPPYWFYKSAYVFYVGGFLRIGQISKGPNIY